MILDVGASHYFKGFRSTQKTKTAFFQIPTSTHLLLVTENIPAGYFTFSVNTEGSVKLHSK